MAYDDDKLGRLFPTRSGDATGTANERKLLDTLGGADNIRTRTQRFVEGTKVTTTRLRTRAGNPEFVTEVTDDDDETPEVFMDSGAVDLVSVAPDNPHSGDDCILFYASVQRTFYALKKLLGKILPPYIKSRKPPDEGAAAKSFKVPPLPDGSRGGELLALLYTKKYCAGYCPASMFTGRARLYAQAQYGALLKQWKWSLELAANGIPELSFDPSPQIRLTTNTGVYLDDQYKHWLITVAGDGVVITRLKRDDAVKPLVRHLRNPAKTAEEKEKIEAYILSRSYPSEAMAFSILVAGLPDPSMLGYGWKFNWSGNKADIIHHEYVYVSSTVLDTRSTHFRLDFNRDNTVFIPVGTSAIDAEKLRWSAMLSTVEGPTQWKNNKYAQVISYPYWSSYALAIFGGSVLGTAHASAAPVYCFYRRDALEVIRYTASGGESVVKYKKESNPVSWVGVHDWSVTNMVSGVYYGNIAEEGGFGLMKTRSMNPATRGFHCGLANGVVTEESFSFVRKECSGKTFVMPGPSETTWFCNFQPTPVEQNIGRPVHTVAVGETGADGVPCYVGGATTTDEMVMVGPGEICSAYTVHVYMNGVYDTSGTHSETAYQLMVIPFKDAEAAYIRGSLSTSHSESGSAGTGYGMDGAWGTFIRISGAQGPFVPRAHSGAFWLNTDVTAYSASSSNEDIVCSKLIAASGAIDFSPPSSLAPFFSGADFVDQQYWTGSSVGGIVFGNGADDPKGMEFFNDPPPFIGWA